MKSKLVVLIGILAIIFAIFAFGQIQMLKKAHSTFNNYYAFRGCVQLIKKTDTYGICKTDKGQTIKIVKFNGKWYLDHDLPSCTFGICF